MKKNFLLLVLVGFIAIAMMSSCGNGSGSSDAESQKVFLSCVLYEDNNGELKNSNGERVCAVRVYSRSEPMNLYFSTEVNWQGLEIKEVYLKNGNVYKEYPYSSKNEELIPIATYNMSTKGAEMNFDFFVSSSEKKVKDTSLAKQTEEKKDENEERKESNTNPSMSPLGEKGWIFLRNRLKSPSTAKLVGHVSPNEDACENMASALNIDGLSIAMYQVDAENSYGAMLRSNYLVFFKDGEPQELETAETIAGMEISMVRVWLQANGF